MADGRKVRLLGINTPELARDGRLPEPLSQAARAALAHLLPPGARVALRYDLEKQDRYGRGLAHVFLPDGTNVQAHLLAQGLATTLVVPPNEWGRECYEALERGARRAGVGLWSLPQYQPVAATTLALDTTGYRLVTGRVQRVGRSQGAVWLTLAPRVSVRIPLADLVHFTRFDPSELIGRELLARGWLYPQRGELRMTVRHPAGLELLE